MSDLDQETEQTPAASWRGAWLLLVPAAGLAAFFLLGLDSHLTIDALREHHGELLHYVDRYVVLSALLFVAAYIASTAFLVPCGAILTITGGLLFGTLAGTTLVVIGASAGATLVFLTAKTVLGDALRARAAPALRKMEAGFRAHELSYLFVLRLVPIFPLVVVNLAPAFLGVRLSNFVLATVLGIIPASFVYASLGHGLGYAFAEEHSLDFDIIFRPEIIVPILGLAALALIPVVYRQIRAAGSS
jgi:uncharacterized membrane protein YdjX (TVP38/TMEM64 family)